MKLTITKDRVNTWLLICAVVILSIGVFLRDVAGLTINKFILLFIAAVPIFLLKIENFLVLASVLVPMFVGLPGNYISLCLLIRLFWEQFYGKTKCNAALFLLTLCIGFYLLAQNFMYDYVEIYHLMGTLDFLILLFFVHSVRRYGVEENVTIAFMVGVVITGVIMLVTTLQHFELKELMDSSTRLGDTDMLYEVTGLGMVVTMDPNFYGMNAIAAISAAIHILFTKKITTRRRMWIIALCAATAVLALVGLSRAFVLGLLLWGILLILTLGDIKKVIPMILGAAAFVVIVMYAFPDVMEGIERRFGEGDVAGGNGRINLIIKYYHPWRETFLTFLFGIGLYNCHTHCAPLLYLFGFGLVGAILVLLWFVAIARILRQGSTQKGLLQWIPLIVTLFLYSMIPAAGAINYTYPMVVALMARGISATGRDAE